MNGFIIAAIIAFLLGFACIIGSGSGAAGVFFVIALVCGVIGGLKYNAAKERKRANVERVAKATFPQLKEVRVTEGGSLMSFRVGSSSASVPCEVEVKMVRGKLHIEASARMQGETLPPSCEQAVLAAGKS